MLESTFQHAVVIVLRHEGGFVDDPADPGGATNFGISLRLARQLGDLDGDGELDLDLDGDGDVDADDIRKLSREQAIGIYRSQWWEKYRYWLLPQAAAVKTFDLSVNMGSRQAHLCLQRALRAAGLILAEDGVLGPKTVTAVETVGPLILLPAFRAEAAGFYRALVARRPASEKHLAGWLNRAYA
jgi:lysozyme family protein